MVQNDDQLLPERIALIREKINNEEYIHEAVQRIAQILSDELLNSYLGGIVDEERE